MIDSNQVLINEIDQYLKRLFPITRSITGPGNRETLRILQEIIPLEIKEYPSSTPVYDWIIPDEWRVQDAWIKDEQGNKIVDFQQSNIHLVSYSEPINKLISFEELVKHIHYHDDLPDAIPYRTTYYKRDWGFCVTQEQYKKLKDTKGLLRVHIDSEFDANGSLTIGEIVIPGKTEKEILISTYFCHPSMANDNLSGLILTIFLARAMLNGKQREHTWRIIFVPETIGAISYCFYNEEKIKKIDAALVLTTVGGKGAMGYKRSFNIDHPINYFIEKAFIENNIEFKTYPFDINGSDERQYSSIGFRINTASITKDKYYEYDYYHTSLDNLDFVKGFQIAEMYDIYLSVIRKLDSNLVFKRKTPFCEVMMSKHNLYPSIGGSHLPEDSKLTDLDIYLWLIWYCDGVMSLHDISIKIDIAIEDLVKLALELEYKKVLIRI